MKFCLPASYSAEMCKSCLGEGGCPWGAVPQLKRTTPKDHHYSVTSDFGVVSPLL